MAHFNFMISQNAKWGHAGFYIDCHRMTVPENILLQKSTGQTSGVLIAAEPNCSSVQFGGSCEPTFTCVLLSGKFRFITK